MTNVPSDSLPSSLKSWSELDRLDRDSTTKPQWWMPWEALRPFFASKGYILFKPGRQDGTPSVPQPAESGYPTSPAAESFGLYGDREGFKSMFGRKSTVFAARDSRDRDVVIKLVRKGDEGRGEYEILRLLNSEDLRHHQGNATVAVLEFIEYDDWHFAVMPFCDSCDELPFRNIDEALDFAEQVMSVLCFLHDHGIAHLDISTENILINHHGKIPGDSSVDDDHHPEFRSTFPVRYLIVDFGLSSHSSYGPDSGFRIDPLSAGRHTKAPESTRSKFDPYAADVYQTAGFLYTWIHEIVPKIPGLLGLLQDMSCFNPKRRLSMSAALSRFYGIRTEIRNREMLYVPHELAGSMFPRIPMRHWPWLVDAICLGEFEFARQFVVAFYVELYREFVVAWKEIFNSSSS